jgi:ankyrin repeat protein
VKDIKHLVNCGNLIDNKLSIFGEAPIHKAVLSKLRVTEKNQALHTIIDSKANLNNMDSNGWTALHHACYNGDLESATILILDGHANVNSYSNQARTPLHFAALNNHKTCIQLLLTKGAQLEWQDEQKCTPLHLACKKGHTESVALLLTSGANIYAQDMRQWSALHYAAYNGHKKVCNQLLKWEADKDVLAGMKNSQDKKPIHICKNHETKEGFKHIWRACREGDLDLVRILIREG